MHDALFAKKISAMGTIWNNEAYNDCYFLPCSRMKSDRRTSNNSSSSFRKALQVCDVKQQTITVPQVTCRLILQKCFIHFGRYIVFWSHLAKPRYSYAMHVRLILWWSFKAHVTNWWRRNRPRHLWQKVIVTLSLLRIIQVSQVFDLWKKVVELSRVSICQTCTQRIWAYHTRT